MQTEKDSRPAAYADLVIEEDEVEGEIVAVTEVADTDGEEAGRDNVM